MATTVHAPVTITAHDATVLSQIVSVISQNPAMSNIVSDEPTLTITFDYDMEIPAP